MFDKYFDRSATEALSDRSSSTFRNLSWPGGMKGPIRSDKRRSQLDALIRRRADALVSAVRLDAYQKAKLSPMLHEALAPAGYADTFSEPFAYDVMKLVAVASTEVR